MNLLPHSTLDNPQGHTSPTALLVTQKICQFFENSSCRVYLILLFIFLRAKCCLMSLTFTFSLTLLVTPQFANICGTLAKTKLSVPSNVGMFLDILYNTGQV